MLYGGGSFDRGEPLQTFLHLNPAAVLSHLSARTGKIEISSTLSAITTQYSGFRRQISVDFVFRKRENFHGRRRKCPIFAQFKTTRNANDLIVKSLAFLKSTRSRGRTGTTLLSLVFETNASTDSAIRANDRIARRIGRTKIRDFHEISKNRPIFRRKP